MPQRFWEPNANSTAIPSDRASLQILMQQNVSINLWQNKRSKTGYILAIELLYRVYNKSIHRVYNNSMILAYTRCCSGQGVVQITLGPLRLVLECLYIDQVEAAQSSLD